MTVFSGRAFQRKGAKAQRAQRMRGNGVAVFSIPAGVGRIRFSEAIFLAFSLRPLRLRAFALDLPFTGAAMIRGTPGHLAEGVIEHGVEVRL